MMFTKYATDLAGPLIKKYKSKSIGEYLDGMLEGESGSAGGVDINPNDWPIMVGAESSSNGGWQFIGTLDDVAVFNRELSAEEILSIFENGIADPGLASASEPQNRADDVLRDSVLSWIPGDFAGTHNVYIGSTFEEVDGATVPTAAGLTVNSYDPGRLEFGKTYFWRVDEVNATPDHFVYKGDTWTFETEPDSVQIPASAIVASASSSAPSGTSNPGKTIDGSGL
ncbi:MAG: LamG domain-containing protein, partial [Planctomycetes bacterium]|nr:LamG domain-containing protein [Planctomycetota bacterium]